MQRSTIAWTVLACAVAALLAVSIYHGHWGAVLMAVIGAALVAWYRVNVARSAAAEKFFDGPGEDTRLTAFQGGSPSEMPVDPPAAGGAGGVPGRPGSPPSRR